MNEFTEDALKSKGYRFIGGVWVKGKPQPMVIDSKGQEITFPKKASKRTGHITDLPLRKISLCLKGEPMPKQSVRSYSNGSFKITPNGKKVFNVFHYQPKEMEDRKKDYQRQLREQLPLDFEMFTQRVHVRKFHCIYAPLKGFSKNTMEIINSGGIVWKETQPDIIDNLKKLTFDSMAGIIYKNDGCIVSEDNVKKYYGLSGYIIIELEGY